jgi:hypothetical protein
MVKGGGIARLIGSVLIPINEQNTKLDVNGSLVK